MIHNLMAESSKPHADYSSKSQIESPAREISHKSRIPVETEQIASYVKLLFHTV